MKEEMERMRRRIEMAERAAEREYMDFDDSVTPNSLITSQKSTREVGIETLQSKTRKLAKKRELERKRRKVAACVKEHVGPMDTIKKISTGNDSRRSFNIKCPECSVTFTRLHQHLQNAHKYSLDDARFKESEIRVMYLWALKEKHGNPKPLPCEICFTWHLRLDHHFIYKHKDISKEERLRLVISTREKYWSNTEVSDNNPKDRKSAAAACATKKSSLVIKNAVAQSSTSGSSLNYMPPGAEKITHKDCAIWSIQNQDFLIYYKGSEELLDAFVEEMSRKHPRQRALNYRAHVEYIWAVIDPDMQLFSEMCLQ